MTTAIAEKTENTQTLDELLKAHGDGYAAVYQEHVVPVMAEMAGYDFKGQLVATTTLRNGNFEVVFGFEFDNKFPDAWEQAHRLIFMGLFAEWIKRHPVTA